MSQFICHHPWRCRSFAYIVAHLCLLLVAHGSPLTAEELRPEVIQFFEKRIRPLLAEHCYECHSAISKSVKGGLLLDSRQAVLDGGDSGDVIVAGRPEQSLLMRAVLYEDLDLQMPPKGKLSATQIGHLNTWIKMGAPDPRDVSTKPASRALDLEAARQHWAFQPLADTTPPTVKNSGWVQTEVDRFILASLEEKGLEPAPPVDKRTLLRRVTFDLTALPPRPEDVAAFVADTSPDAFGKVVDRLLASTAYGEKWGRHWLDVVRYADTSGKDENAAFGNAYRYRDYTITAFNTDKPYDRFLHEQIAGDLMEAESEAQRYEQIIGAGFLQLGPKAIAEQDKPKMLMDIVDEQIEVVGQALMGMTVACARCHDHKFDPIPTRDYYALAGIFRSTRTIKEMSFVSWWLDTPLADAASVAKFKELNKPIEEKGKEIDAAIAAAGKSLVAAWRQDLPRYLVMATWLSESVAGDDSQDVNHVAAREALSPLVLGRCVEALQTSRRPGAKGSDVFALWHGLTSLTSDQFGRLAANRIAQALHRHRDTDVGLLVAEWFEGFKPASLAEVARRYDEMFAHIDALWEEALRNKVPNVAVTALSDVGPDALRRLLYGPSGLFALPQNARRHYLPESLALLEELEKERDELQTEAPTPLPAAISVEDGDIADLKIHVRGNHLNLGESVPRGFLSVVPVTNMPQVNPKQSGRLELAQWLTRPDHPLTSRVLVNRIWLWHFGSGLCRTPDNFGIRGDVPLHLPLLDWLSRQLISSGWSVKRLQRLVLLSSTYQMSGRDNAAATAADPENRLHWRFDQRRLAAEEIRDGLLSVSGQLDLSLGGSLLNHDNRAQHVDTKKTVAYGFNRRSVYLPIVRNALYDVFQLFDHGNAHTVNGQRSHTTVAPQALFFMNSELVMDAAKLLAEDLLADAEAGIEERVVALYMKAFGRPPTSVEVQLAQKYLQRFADVIAEPEAAANERRVRSWEALCHAVLVSNEFVFVE